MVVRFCNTRMEMDESSQELTEHGSALFPAACYEDDLTEGPVPWHWHPELELAVVVKGSAVVAADAQRCTLGEGDGCFINANAIHAAWSADGQPCVIHSVVFHPKLVGGAPESVFWSYLHGLIHHPALRFVPLSTQREEDLPLLKYIKEKLAFFFGGGVRLRVRSAQQAVGTDSPTEPAAEWGFGDSDGKQSEE